MSETKKPSAEPPRSAAARKPGPPPAKVLVLVAVSGDLQVGEEFEITLGEPLSVGRAAKGIQLTDPLVSIQHAIVFHDARRGYVVEDLKSATGTWVDEEQVRGESRPIGVGTRLRFGDCTFEVQPAHRTPGFVKWFAVAAGVLVVTAIAVFAAQQFVSPPEPALACPDANLVGAVPLKSFHFPKSFLRERGLVFSDLLCRRQTDEDDDGRVEAWVTTTDDREFVVVPRADGTINVLGELPANCTQRGQDDGGDFPILDCGGEQWMFVDGAYQVVRHEGVVVWYYESTEPEPEPEPTTPSKSKKGEVKAKAAPEPTLTQMPGLQSHADRGPIKVGRFALRSDERLGAFLAFRGVDRPAHYVICEESFPGIAAQALLDDESVVQLRIACISDLRLTGSPNAKPIAIALSAAGRRALVDDVTTFYAGSPDGLFLDGSRRELIEQIGKDPGYLVGARKLVGDTKESDAAPLTPTPDPSRVITVAHVLEARDSRLEAAPIASSVTIVNEGRATVDPPGCSVLELQTGPFARYGFSSLTSNSFLTVSEIGCGERRTLGTIGYTGGVQDFELEGLTLRVATESRGSTRGLEIARARLAWHPR